METLSDTSYCHRVRIPIRDFVSFPQPQTPKGEVQKPVPLEHPRKYFRCGHGLYLCTSFHKQFFEYLQPKPQEPNIEFVFACTLYRPCHWKIVQEDLQLEKRPVPWWVIRPWLAYLKQSGEPWMDSRVPTPFFMEAQDNDGKTFKKPVSLSLHSGNLHTEWWLNVFAPESQGLFQVGHTFFAAA